MWVEGKIFKPEQGKYFSAEVSDLDVYTQGRSKRHAVSMLKDAITLLAEDAAIKMKLEVLSGKNGSVYIGSPSTKPFIAFLLKRQRQKYGLTISQVISKMGVGSKTAYARYEQGKSEPSLSKLQELLSAINPASRTVINVG